MHFTLDTFIKLNRSKDMLTKYFNAFKKYQKKLQIQAKANHSKFFIPSTFDEMMVNLGYHAERREINDKIDVLDKDIDQNIDKMSN